MSHNHHAAPVPFKVNFPHLYDVEVEYEDDEFWERNQELFEQVKEDLEVLPAEHAIGKKIPEALRRIVQATVLFDCYQVDADPVKGWKAVKGYIDKEHGKKYDGIIGHKIVKGDHVAWYVNESHASNVGYVTPAFVAFSKASIEAIKRAFGGRIETDTVVNSSW